MTQIPDEALGQMMERYDGTKLSHSGIAVHIDEHGETHRDRPANGIASALAERLDGDYGGVRWDEFEKFWPSRDFYTVAMSDRHRERALDYLDEFTPVPGGEGAFSFVKLVNVAAGLRSVALQETNPGLAEELFVAARDVATAWAATPEDPSSSAYYCAELVAHAYGRTFTRAEMTPPAAPKGGIEPEDIEEPEWAEWVVKRLRRRLDDLEDPDHRTAATLLALLSAKDWDFLALAITSVATSGGQALSGILDGLLDDVRGWMRRWGWTNAEEAPVERPRVPRPLAPPRRLPTLRAPNSPVPPALVTPRMLWVAFGPQTLCRVEQGRS
ncbi:hypothetical protein ACR9E3_16845 [Actinomycetospora sp. C-140]